MPHSNSPLADLAMAERLRHLAVKGDDQATLRAITELAIETTVSDHASVTLIECDRTLNSAAATDHVASAADALQYELKEGPCLTAASRGGYYVIDDVATDPRWPAWGPAVAEQFGIRSVLSIHLFTAENALGALNLYDDQLRSYSEEEVTASRVVAAHASVALSRLRAESDLWRAIDARHLIGLAQGILIERFSLNSEQAFAVLRRYSQNNNLKLAVVAERLVDTGQLPGSDSPASQPAAAAPQA